MSMTELRIIILLIGAVILGLIYYFGTRKNKNEAESDFLDFESNFELDMEKPRPNDLPRKSTGITVDQAHDLHQKEALQKSSNEKIITCNLHHSKFLTRILRQICMEYKNWLPWRWKT